METCLQCWTIGKVIVGLVLTLGLYMVRRWWVMRTGTAFTNFPFILDFHLSTGSRNIIFEHNKTFAENADDRHEKLSDAFGCFFGTHRHYTARDVELIGRVLNDCDQRMVTSQNKHMKRSVFEACGDDWKKARDAIEPGLSEQWLKSPNNQVKFDDNIKKTCEFIKEKIDSGSDTLDVEQVARKMVLQTILDVLFDSDEFVNLNSETNEYAEFAHSYFNTYYQWAERQIFLNPCFSWFINRFAEPVKSDGLIIDLIEALLVRKEKKLAAGNADKSAPVYGLIEAQKKGLIHRDFVTGHSFGLIMIGFTNLADTLTAFLWFMSKNQTSQNRLRQDLLKFGEESEFLSACIEETLRLCPGFLPTRHITKTINHKNFYLFKGSSFSANIFSLNRDPLYWGKTALDWNPDRFKQSERDMFHPYQFIPFGVGPRKCIGQKFALIELKKSITQLLLRFTFDVCSKTADELSFNPLGAPPMHLPLKGPYYLTVSPASKS